MKKNLRTIALLLTFALSLNAQTTPAPKPLELLKHRLEVTSQGVSADWGIYIKSLDTGEEIAINADAAMDTMSTIKIPLLVDVFRQVDAGKLHPEERIVMRTADKRFGTGVLRTLDDGLNLSFHDALTLMVIQSDNTATDMAFSRAGGPAHVTQLMHQMGLNSIVATGTTFDWFRALAEAGDPSYGKLSPGELFTKGFPDKLTDAEVEKFHFEGKHPFGLSSARDMGRLLEMIATNKAASEKSCKDMMHILGQQQMRTRIPKYIEDDSNTPHKTGDFPPYIANDVGKPPTFRVAPDRIRFDNHAEVGTRMAEEICHRFRLSNEETEQVSALVANHMRFADVMRMKDSTLKRFFRLPKFEEHLELHRLDCMSSHRDLTLYAFTREKLASMKAEQIHPAPLITGKDLIAAGYKPGPLFKELLMAVEDAQLEGTITTREEAMGLVKSLILQTSSPDQK